ncbi:MAG TPA: response regulator, partial [Gemmatimonadales bacterium]|nr:response regulator [Gemmatimonadales bacterium]
TGLDRRNAERRRLPDRRRVFDRRYRRRRTTPTPFNAEESARAQRMFQVRGHRPACPACGGDFVLSRERKRGAELVRKVECGACRKAAVVTNTFAARVLFVAPDSAVRDGVRSMLLNAGHDVTEAEEVEAALSAWRDDQPDLAVVDLSAPGRLDGQGFVRRLRAEFHQSPVVAMAPRASYGTADPLAAARQMGAARTLRMPFSTEELLSAIDQARRA